MTRALVALFIAVQALDLATYLSAPHLEGNPAMAGLSPGVVAVAKVAGVLGALLIVRILDRRYHDLAALGLAIGIAVGALGVGANTAVLSIVRAAEAPGSAPLLAIPTDEGGGAGRSTAPASPDGRRVGTDAAVRTPAPGHQSRKPAELRTVSTTGRAARPAPLRGVASWYRQPGLVAAAGPRLRAWLGPDWRGRVVDVCAERCVVVRLSDWCQCYRGRPTERLIDLSDQAFAAIAPLVAGLVEVTVRPSHLEPPSTDR